MRWPRSSATSSQRVHCRGSLGVIPRATRERVIWPQETFHVYDDTLVSVELVSAGCE